MAYYAVKYRFTTENTVLVQADSKQEAMDKFNGSDWDLANLIDEQPYDMTKALKAELSEV